MCSPTFLSPAAALVSGKKSPLALISPAAFAVGAFGRKKPQGAISESGAVSFGGGA